MTHKIVARGLMPAPDRPDRVNVKYDPSNIQEMRGLRDHLTDLIESAIRQQAADYGQLMALNGKTSPERRAMLGPENDDARKLADAFEEMHQRDGDV